MSNAKTVKDYKDRLFRMIFNDKEKLLELYNAMNGSDYKDANMPLRCLFYASDTYSVLVKDKNIYGSKMLLLPSPTFVVFYNGKQEMDEE